jgi:tRNA U34 5-methylaminomethyl-2-thiouridine-forming methyltransferase MnmC
VNRELIVTADGSHTLRVNDWNETYHSIYGAVQESRHIYINAGLKPLLEKQQTLRIFEMGFGTGLNASLTFEESLHYQTNIWYETIEAYPLQPAEYQALNYSILMGQNSQKPIFNSLHGAEWEKPVQLHPHFTLLKKQHSLLNYHSNTLFDLVYFDAFAPDVQPELWTNSVFQKMYNIMSKEAVLITYCSKSMVRKAMLEAGFTVSKLPGPPGKREIMKAIKHS